MANKKINHPQEMRLLKRKIMILEEELVRKQEQISRLKQENNILFNSAIKRSEKLIDEHKNKE